jgi:hypothetical protein
LLSVGALLVQRGAGPRMDGHRNQLCELCGQRLSRVKHTREYGAGRACHPRCKLSKRAADEAAGAAPAVTAAPKGKKRRAASDPGEAPVNKPSPRPQPTTRRVIPSPAVSTEKKQHRTRLEEKILRQLEETAARREAALAAAAATGAVAHP